MSRDLLSQASAALRRQLEEQGVAIDPRAIKPAELVRLLNSTPAGVVLDDRRLYRHRSKAGARIGDGKSIDLFRYAAWLYDEHAGRPAPPAVPVPAEASAYEAHKERARARADEASKKGRDIGRIPPIADIKRRAACRLDLERFARTYHASAFSLPFSPYHRRMIRRIESSVIDGGFYAFAFPRGFGKTTNCRVAIEWAIANAHIRYGFLIGANEAKALANLGAIKKLMRQPMFAADYPEISRAFEHLQGIANRAAGQMCQGEPTAIVYEKTQIVLPTVPCPPNWPDDWPIGADGKAPTSGSIIGVSGLTGDGIRGSLYTTESGDMVRPELVLLDDPQTDESARSQLQNKTREDLINGAVLGMEGPDKPLAVIMPCTIIAPDDLASRFLDRKRNPLWRGETCGILESMPTNMEAWDQYAEVFYACAQLDPPNFAKANAYYKRHRKTLDAGAKAAWPELKADCVSAIQFAMNRYYRHGTEAFFAEYMNAPLVQSSDEIRILEPADISARFNGRPRTQVPPETSSLTGFIDIHGDVLYWSVLAVDQEFSGSVVDYGTYPQQPVPYFLKRNARKTLKKMFPKAGEEEAVSQGVAAILLDLFGRRWQTSEGDDRTLSILGIDEGYEKTAKAIERMILRTGNASRIFLSKGVGIGVRRQPMHESYNTRKKRKAKRILKHGGKQQWYLTTADGIRRVKFDTNYWKTFLHSRLCQPLGTTSAVDLFGSNAQTHMLFAEHLACEIPAPLTHEGTGRKVIEWAKRPGRDDNHWLDCVVGSLVAAAIDGGSSLPSEGPANPAPPPVPTMSPAELRARKRGRR
jgi:hypothetical protein